MYASDIKQSKDLAGKVAATRQLFVYTNTKAEDGAINTILKHVYNCACVKP